jgi:dTDP-4-dehydrorhamnose reductase
VSAARYPVLWERNELAWARPRLEALRDRNVEPIVTLVHHGSGPPQTDLLDEHFPELLADYAGRVARAFPWVRRWTPINEPLTTARFSTLYGFWYPNRVDDHAAFGRAITNEALGIIEAMERIRAIIPRADLIMTEDLQRFTAGDAGVTGYVAHKRERM